MNSDLHPKRKRWWSEDDGEPPADNESHHHSETDAVRLEVKHLRRVVKRGDRAIKHMSETLESEKVTQKDIEVTKEILRGVSNLPGTTPSRPVSRGASTFACFECGARIPYDSVRCPQCGVLYVQDPNGVVVDEVPSDQDEAAFWIEDASVFNKGVVALVHFDTSTGIVTCLQSDGRETDWGLECHNCGAVVQFMTDRCPLCGHSFDESDTGLVGLLTGLKFDLDGDKELDCPSCGHHVVAEEGLCPICKEMIAWRNDRAADAVVLPLLDEKDVIFVHLDVWNDEIWFASKVKFRRKKKDDSIHLDVITKSDFEHEWKGLTRI